MAPQGLPLSPSYPYAGSRCHLSHTLSVHRLAFASCLGYGIEALLSARARSPLPHLGCEARRLCTPGVSRLQSNMSHCCKHDGGTGTSFCRSRGASAANASLRHQLRLLPRGAQNVRGPRGELCARCLIYERPVSTKSRLFALPVHPPSYDLAKAEPYDGHYAP